MTTSDELDATLERFWELHPDVVRPLVQREAEEIHPAAHVDRTEEPRVYPHEHPLPDNVEQLDIVTTADFSLEFVLRNAFDAGLTECVIVGFDKDGEEFFASMQGDTGKCMFLLQRGQHRLNMTMDELIERGEDPRGPKIA